MNLKHFKTYSKQDILSLTRLRKYETKIGERVLTLPRAVDDLSVFSETDARYIVVGIPEDIGVLANGGVAGAGTSWLPFLQAFLNTQSNDFLEGSDIAIAGCFDFGDIQYLIERNAFDVEERTDAYRHAVSAVDEEVEKLVKAIIVAGKTPLIIGGGHNNAYPLIKGTAKGLHQAQKVPLAQINCINLDAHTDYRPAEGRHSGNGFRYAEEDGFLLKYCVVGVHENSLPQNVWMDIVNNPFIDCITFEDVFIRQKRNFMQAAAHAVSFTEDNFTGLEIDLDVAAHVLSSAASPSGISELELRQYISYVAATAKVAYLHICEGAAQLADGRTDHLLGKLISFLVIDFIKARNEHPGR
ncbi:MAG TPA: formimidoylglutamase [Chitinophagaceae bacterium]|nr:formimidoylglutamase [Chitinophagaceae bacterium]